MRRATVVVFYIISGMIHNVLPVSGSIFGRNKKFTCLLVANTVCIPKVTIEKLT